MHRAKPTYAEFSDPRLVALYDLLNALGADSDFFCNKAAELHAATIIDLGCGTGLLTCELARRGHKMIGIEPAKGMLDIARSKPFSDQVTWVEGGAEKMAGLKADLVIMTSHVAQFFLEDKDWVAVLTSAHSALNPGGHIMFDARNPNAKPWEKWTREASTKKVITPQGEVEMWYQLLEVNGNRVLYEIHYHFTSSGEELVSVNELIYRSRDEITKYLSEAGFSVSYVYGDWDGAIMKGASPEMIFVASRD